MTDLALNEVGLLKLAFYRLQKKESLRPSIGTDFQQQVSKINFTKIVFSYHNQFLP